VLVPFFHPSNEGAERREAPAACEAPLADLAIDPPEHRAKAFARLATADKLAQSAQVPTRHARLPALHRGIFRLRVRARMPPGSGVTNPARRQPHPVSPSQRLAMTPLSGKDATNINAEKRAGISSGDRFFVIAWSVLRKIPVNTGDVGLWGKSGYDTDVAECLGMTRSGHGSNCYRRSPADWHTFLFSSGDSGGLKHSGSRSADVQYALLAPCVVDSRVVRTRTWLKCVARRAWSRIKRWFFRLCRRSRYPER
jgi:hypothetical protein